MTSISMNASRARAGMLVVALALVGGTGCITTAIVQNVQKNNRLREMEQERQKNIARLTPLADAGDPAAATALVRELLEFIEPQPVDQGRVFALLSGAAGKGYGPAQALLGQILVAGHFETFSPQVVEPRFQDRERGFEWLRRAAVQSCTYTPSPGRRYYRYSWIQPAAQLGYLLGRYGHADEGRVWHARSVMHCSYPAAQNLYLQTTFKSTTPRLRTDALAELLLTGDSALIEKAEAAMPADDVAAARRDAEQLRRQVAQSEQQYPAPSRKDRK